MLQTIISKRFERITSESTVVADLLYPEPLDRNAKSKGKAATNSTVQM